jgi:hypothetical protein
VDHPSPDACGSATVMMIEGYVIESMDDILRICPQGLPVTSI